MTKLTAKEQKKKVKRLLKSSAQLLQNIVNITLWLKSRVNMAAKDHRYDVSKKPFPYGSR